MPSPSASAAASSASSPEKPSSGAQKLTLWASLWTACRQPRLELPLGGGVCSPPADRYQAFPSIHISVEIHPFEGCPQSCGKRMVCRLYQPRTERETAPP